MSEAKWYVVHTYSGYENKVKANIEKTIENRHLEDQILEVRVPLQEVVEMRNGAAKQVQKKMFPGYVLLNMVMNDDTWYVVRNTRGVTGFVGVGSDPIPLADDEAKSLLSKIGLDESASAPKARLDLEVGEKVIVKNGAFENQEAEIAEVDHEHGRVKVMVEVFGRMTPVELEYHEVRKI